MLKAQAPYTNGAAASTGEERIKGRLAPGYVARREVQLGAVALHRLHEEAGLWISWMSVWTDRATSAAALDPLHHQTGP